MTYGTCPKAYFGGDQLAPKLFCVIKNHGPGAAHAVTIMLGMLRDAKKTLLIKKILVADILVPGDRIKFEKEISKDDLPSSEEREFPRSQSKGRTQWQPNDLCDNVQYAALEYTDAETTPFHAMRWFVLRNSTTLCGIQTHEMSDSQKFATTEVKMQFFNDSHPDNFCHDETEEMKAQRLGKTCANSIT